MNWITLLLLVVFLVHLVVFIILGLRRRQLYYLSVIVTFSLLCAAMMFVLWWPELSVGEVPVHALLRRAGWMAASVSIVWTAVRLVNRLRGQSGRQNCS
ncbi:MAG: hypothetical protein EA370_02935 [Wenzhouxiangella sp.]|nr:MAG: hypothetical protein EA370_02935 [Wenzhouxiangella sp.]